MFDMEEMLVDTNFIKRKDTYNLVKGGRGGYDNTNSDYYVHPRGMLGKHHSEKSKKKMAKFGKDNGMYGKPGVLLGKPGMKNMLGKHHTEETKQKIREANSKNQSGSRNSQYGKCWIYCPYTHESKPIPGYELKEWEDRGWVKGRKIIRP